MTVSTPAVPSTRSARSLGRWLREGAQNLAERVATPLVPADYLDLVDPLLTRTDLRARLVEVRPETTEAATLVLRPGRGWQAHVPGQYVRLGVDVDGVRLWRSYSLTGGPDIPAGCIAVTVKALPGGRVSEFLVRRARPGLVVQLEQAAGEFVLASPAPVKALFVTAGSGITPVMGMLRHHLDALADVVVVHSAPTPEHVVFGAELRALHAAGRIRLVERHTRTQGHLKPAELDDLLDDLAERAIWACGPAGMLDDLEQHLAVLGRPEQLRTERFAASLVAPGEGGTAHFTRSGVTVETTGATALLDAGEAAGVLMPSGCRMGICFGCVLPLRSGAVRDLRNGAVTTAEPGDGVKVQTCISAAAGPCELEN